MENKEAYRQYEEELLRERKDKLSTLKKAYEDQINQKNKERLTCKEQYVRERKQIINNTSSSLCELKKRRRENNDEWINSKVLTDNLEEKKPLTNEELALKRKQEKLPRYTKGEEIFNSVTHMVGGGFGVIFLVVGIVCAVIFKNDPVTVTSMTVFGICSVFLYTMSSIYHALHINKAKKVFQIIDHCTIYVLIAGTYVPVCLMQLTQIFPYNYVLLGSIVLMAALGISLNGTMMDKIPVKIISYTLYIAMGWAIFFFYPYLVQTLTIPGTWLFIGGGISYTVGAILFAIGKNVPYFHSIFHLFVNAATLLQFLSILLYGIIFPALGMI